MGAITDRGNHPITELVVVESIVADQELEGWLVPDLGERPTR
jgi:hypothetical protein